MYIVGSRVSRLDDTKGILRFVVEPGGSTSYCWQRLVSDSQQTEIKKAHTVFRVMG